MKEQTKETKPKKSAFDTLFEVNVNDHVEKKNGLNYLSWSYAWAEVKKYYPDANYEIKHFGENNLPYVYDENTGYMVFTNVTINNITHEMWLPVMDASNKAMKSKPYSYATKYGKSITVAPATMFDINKTIMRCLVKNLAMFGLGLYIYSGEDLPESTGEEKEPEHILENKKKMIKTLIQKYSEKSKTPIKDISSLLAKEIGKSLQEMNSQDADKIINKMHGLLNI